MLAEHIGNPRTFAMFSKSGRMAEIISRARGVKVHRNYPA